MGIVMSVRFSFLSFFVLLNCLFPMEGSLTKYVRAPFSNGTRLFYMGSEKNDPQEALQILGWREAQGAKADS